MNPNKNICSTYGCGKIGKDGSNKCEEHTYKIVRTKTSDLYKEYQHLYSDSGWRHKVAEIKRKEVFCVSCEMRGIKKIGSEVDHVFPHKGDINKFFSGKLQLLCKSCHSKKTNQEMRGRIVDFATREVWELDKDGNYIKVY